MKCFSCCECCCDKHGCTRIFEALFSVLLGIYPEVGLLGHVVIRLSFQGTSSFPQPLHRFTFPPAVHEGPNVSTSSPTLVLVVGASQEPSSWVSGGISLRFWSASPMISEAEHLFMCLLSICVRLWRKVYSRPLPMFQSGYFVFLLLSYRRSLYILEINPLSGIWL